jgi:hypothetical protein
MKNGIDVQYARDRGTFETKSRTLVIKEEGKPVQRFEISDSEAISLITLLLESHPAIYSSPELQSAGSAIEKYHAATVAALEGVVEES